MKTTRIRWGDNDRYFGPFTYARDRESYRPFAFIIASGKGADADYESEARCSLRVSAFGHTLLIALPAIVKPDCKWVDTSHYEWSKGPGSGYWDYSRREYGFSLNKGFLNVSYGRSTNDSSTEQRWGYFLPWTEWRHVRHSFYGLSGEHVSDMPQRQGRAKLGQGEWQAQWDHEHAIEEAVPTRTFPFADFDGEKLTATTKIEEREWRLGVRWFKWLALFAPRKIRRSLDIRFSGETGKRKGSWKGGTIGTGIDMLPGELHEGAFRRYCAENRMAFIGAPEPVPC